MGRPNLYFIRTHISFSNEALKRMSKITSAKGRSELVRIAVDKHLDEVEGKVRPKRKRA